MTPTGPLDGIRVIEVGTLISGPFAGRLLGDMGAEVVKIEPPGAPDPLRTWGQAELDGHHFFWTVHARNKKAVTLNLREGAGRELFLDLVEKSDIIVENFRPGTLEKWDLGYDVLRERNRGIILVRVSGYGQTGPEAHKAGYASVAEAASGLRHMNGFPGGPPPRLALSLGDSLAGMFAAQGALAALYRRTVTGEGQVVDAALTESCLAVQESTIPDYDVGGVVRGPSGTRLEGIAPSNIYPTADGSWVVIAANQDTVFRRLCGAMGQPELATDDRFANHVARGRNQDELDKIIGAWAAERQPADIIATLSDAGVISGPINTVAEVVADPQLQSRGMIADHWDERIERNVKGPGVVPVLSETPGTIRNAGPARPGQHNDEIYRGLLGKTDDELDALAGGGRAMTELPAHVDIRDVSLRDGLQIEDPIPLSAKLELLAAVAATGVREMEATAFVSPSKVPALADAADLAAELHNFPDIEFSALVASPNGAKRAIAAGLHSIEYVVSAADGHSRANVGRSTAEATAQIPEIVAIAHDSGVSVEVIVATAWDCPFDGPTPRQRVVDVVTAATDADVDRLAIADTIGTTTPRRVSDLIAKVRPLIGDIPLGAHFHNTRGTGLASAYAAVSSGVTRLDASVGGLGGCPFAPGASGNIATEDLVYLLRDSGIHVDIDLQAAIAAARVAQDVVGHNLPSSLLRAGDRIRD